MRIPSTWLVIVDLDVRQVIFVETSTEAPRTNMVGCTGLIRSMSIS